MGRAGSAGCASHSGAGQQLEQCARDRQEQFGLDEGDA
jgi:hypothetical protein